MRVVLWDTRRNGAYKDFAGGFGVGTFRGKNLRSRIVERFFRRDSRSPALAYGYLAAILKRAGHEVSYSLEATPAADLYIFNPALMTLPHELAVMRRLNEHSPATQILVVGQVASTLPEAFAAINCRVLKGEAEQLATKLDGVLASGDQIQEIGTVADLDSLPFPDWAPFDPRKFQVAYDFSQFPTAYIQSSRGCTLSCSYCPYIILENRVRARSAESVVDEMRQGMAKFGFKSFKFRDPLFGAKRKHVEQLAEQIGKLPRRVQFSVESRIELLPREVLSLLRDVGLTSVTIGIETPSRDTLVKYKRAPIRDDKQAGFVDMCRGLGIRVIAGFMIGFPDDTRESMRTVFRYAKKVNPFVANFNVCTPYPGTAFLTEIADVVAHRDWSKYDVYTPNLKYEHLTADEVQATHQSFFRNYYFRWNWIQANWPFLAPGLHKLLGSKTPVQVPEPVSTTSGLQILESACQTAHASRAA